MRHRTTASAFENLPDSDQRRERPRTAGHCPAVRGRSPEMQQSQRRTPTSYPSTSRLGKGHALICRDFSEGGEPWERQLLDAAADRGVAVAEDLGRRPRSRSGRPWWRSARPCRSSAAPGPRALGHPHQREVVVGARVDPRLTGGLASTARASTRAGRPTVVPSSARLPPSANLTRVPSGRDGVEQPLVSVAPPKPAQWAA